MSRYQNAGRSHIITIDNSSFERVEQFKYLLTNLTKQNSIQEEYKSRFETGNACYHSVQKLLSSSLLSKNVKIKNYRIMIFPLVLYGRETWALTSREERRLRMFENRVLRKVFGPKRDEVAEEWRKLHNEELNDLYSPNILVNLSRSKVMISVIGYLMLLYHYRNYLMSYVIKGCLSISMYKQEKGQP